MAIPLSDPQLAPTLRLNPKPFATDSLDAAALDPAVLADYRPS